MKTNPTNRRRRMRSESNKANSFRKGRMRRLKKGPRRMKRRKKPKNQLTLKRRRSKLVLGKSNLTKMLKLPNDLVQKNNVYINKISS